MKDVCKVLGMIAFVAIVGFSTSSCIINLDDDGGGGQTSNPFSGTWYGTGECYGYSINFSSSSWAMTTDEGDTYRGTYTYRGNYATGKDNSFGLDITARISGSNLSFEWDDYTYTFRR